MVVDQDQDERVRWFTEIGKITQSYKSLDLPRLEVNCSVKNLYKLFFRYKERSEEVS